MDFLKWIRLKVSSFVVYLSLEHKIVVRYFLFVCLAARNFRWGIFGISFIITVGWSVSKELKTLNGLAKNMYIYISFFFHWDAPLEYPFEKFCINIPIISILCIQIPDNQRLWSFWTHISQAHFLSISDKLSSVLFCSGRRWRAICLC